MKTNKTKAIKQFQEDIMIAMGKYYKQAISESIKRGLARKKLSTH